MPLASNRLFAADNPRARFEGELEAVGFATPNSDIAPDGRLLMIEGSPSVTFPLTVAENWSTELRRKLGR
jgi:hypothetical protein